jgi:hypothetical protein
MQKIDKNYESSDYNSHLDPNLSDLYVSTDGITDASFQEPDLKLKSLNERLIIDQEVKSDFKNEMLNILENLYFQFGERSDVEDVFKKYHDKYGIIAIDWLNKIFISNINNPKISLGIILLLSTLNAENVGSFGETMLLNALLTHNDIEIQEAAIRTIENWHAIEFIDILRHKVFQAYWLDSYKESVIAELSSCLF